MPALPRSSSTPTTHLRGSTRPFARLGVIALVTALASCSGGGGGDTPTAPPVLTTITVAFSTNSIPVGTPSFATATGADQKGGAIATGTVIWSSSAPNIATVAASGSITTLAAGQTIITATAGTKSGQATLTVVPVPVAAVTVAPASAALAVGGTQQFTATPIDAGNTPLTGRVVTWTSSDPSKASVSATGLVTGVAVGNATITATSEGKSVTAAVVVANSATIASISPTTLVPGTTFTVNGVNFGATIAANTVRVAGVTATITSATTTQITATVPCIASGSSPVVVTTSAVNSPAVNATVAGSVRTLAVGQAVVLTTAAASACNELPAATGTPRYLVTVFSNAQSQNTLIDAELRGNPLTSAAPPGSALRAAPQILRSLRTSAVPLQGTGSASDREHLNRLEAGRALYQQLRASGYRAPVAAPGARTSALRLSNSLGDSRSFFYNYTCSDTTKRIGAKIIYVGTKAIIWEDTTNTRQSSADANLASYYQRIGQLFDTEQYDVVKTNFGDPLLRDPVTDADGRLNMIFTQRVNASGVAAFVNPCDQFPRTAGSSVAASNFGEYFYASVPTLAGSSPDNVNYADGWFSFIGRTVVHEVKHIAMAAARVANGASAFEESWLEEGLARQAEELWVRQYIHHVAWKGNSGYGTASTNGVFCDFNPASATCLAGDPTHRPSYGVRRQFNELLPKLVEPWNWSPYGDGSTQSGSVFYQTVWSLTRYTADRYATSDAAFFTALTNATTTGVTSLSTVAGVSMDQLLGGWGLALYADDYPGLTSPSADITFPTWNTRDIYNALSTDPNWNTRFTLPFPLVPSTLSFGPFTATQSGIRGGAAAYYVITGSMTAPQILDLRAIGGGAPSASLRIAIARLP